MPVFALLALVAYSVSLALLFPVCCKKTAAGGAWLLFLRHCAGLPRNRSGSPHPARR